MTPHGHDPTPPAEDALVDPERIGRGDADGLVAPPGYPLDAGGHAPLREIAQAFRMNAEALHTLKQMQAEIASSVKRGDRSELVLQSTRALNDTFRNLTSVQRELLEKINGRDKPAGRGPLVPLMILGLLIAVLAGVYVILGEIKKNREVEPALGPAQIAQRFEDSWKSGRIEGARQSEREIERLTQALEEAKSRSSTLQTQLDERQAELNGVDRARRTAELERDEFAGQVRKALDEVTGKKALEDEIAALRMEQGTSTREVTDLQVALERKRQEAAWLRQRLADLGMGIPEDDPPYRAPGSPEAAAAAKAEAALVKPEAPPLVNLLTAGRQKIEAQDRAAGRLPAADAPRRPAEPAPAPARPGPTGPAAVRGGDVPGAPAPFNPPAAATPRKPGELPPPILRRRSGVARDPASLNRVREHINDLLGKTVSPRGERFLVTRVDGVAPDRVAGVVVLRYDAADRLIDHIEAKDMRITLDRERRRVEFDFAEGVRVARDQRVPLPREGAKFVIAEGDAAGAWANSGLRMLRRR
jgi:hypothetical protein